MGDIFQDFKTKICSAWLNKVDWAVTEALGAPQTPEEALSNLNGLAKGPSDGVVRVVKNGALEPLGTQAPPDHNDLPSRDAAGAHPISSITGLDAKMTELDQAVAWGNHATAGYTKAPSTYNNIGYADNLQVLVQSGSTTPNKLTLGDIKAAAAAGAVDWDNVRVNTTLRVGTYTNWTGFASGFLLNDAGSLEGGYVGSDAANSYFLRARNGADTMTPAFSVTYSGDVTCNGNLTAAGTVVAHEFHTKYYDWNNANASGVTITGAGQILTHQGASLDSGAIQFAIRRAGKNNFWITAAGHVSTRGDYLLQNGHQVKWGHQRWIEDYEHNNGDFGFYFKEAVHGDIGRIGHQYAKLVGAANITTTVAATMVVTTDGWLRRSTSSGKYKSEVRQVESGLSFVQRLRPVTFHSLHKSDDADKRFMGFIAEEVADVLPEADVDNRENYDVRSIVAVLVAAVKELQARVEALEAA